MQHIVKVALEGAGGPEQLGRSHYLDDFSLLLTTHSTANMGTPNMGLDALLQNVPRIPEYDSKSCDLLENEG